jgi:magnesium-transporting ATPase (P-type)
MNFKTLFHYISYLQYPLMLIGLYFAFKPYFLGIEQLRENPDLIFKNLNSLLIFMGLGVSFSSLQDTTKTQNKFSEKIWKNPKKGKLMIVFFLTFGLIGYYFAKVGVLKELSIGIIVLGLGMFGFLKAAIEMFENHRTDKK